MKTRSRKIGVLVFKLICEARHKPWPTAFVFAAFLKRREASNVLN